MSFFRLIKDHSGCCILDQLQRLDSTCGKTRQESITIVQSGENKSLVGVRRAGQSISESAGNFLHNHL